MDWATDPRQEYACLPDSTRCSVSSLVGKTATLYRVEFPDGYGPYYSWIPLAGLRHHRYRAFGDAHRPAPWELGSGMPHELVDGRYAFPSIGALKRWFGKQDRRHLQDLGLRLVKLRAKVTWHHHIQVCFDATTREDITTLDLVRL